MFKTLKSKLSPYAVLIAGLAVVTLVTAWAGIWQYHYELSHSTKIGSSKTTKPTEKSGQTSVGQLLTNPAADNTISSSSTTKTSTPKTSNSSPSQSPVTTPAASQDASQPQTINVSLSINGAPAGTVNLPSGANQCDVLSQAFAQGVISSLDMRYSQNYGTYGVYVINGQGDPNTIWWTYKVNGVAPPYGCAYIKAQVGDQVNWQYIKK